MRTLTPRSGETVVTIPHWSVSLLLVSLALGGCSAPEYVAPTIEKPEGPLSLDAAVELAFRNNPDVFVALQKLSAARTAIDEALSHYWPALQFVESFTMTNQPSRSFGMILDQRRFEPGIDFNNPGVNRNWHTGFGGSVTLYDGGRRRARWQARVAEANSEAAMAELVQRDLALEVARAYYTIHKARETAQTQKKSIETLNTHLRITEARQAEGAARRSEVLAVRVRLAETKEAAIVAENTAERALGGLRLLLGLEITVPLELEAPESMEPVPAGDLGALLERAQKHRMELIAAEQQVEAAKARVREAVAGYHPEVSIFGGFSFEDRNIADFKYGNWFWGVSFVYSIFNIFRTPYYVDQAVAERAAAYARSRKALLEVELDVNNARLDGEEADARHDVASQAAELSEESLRLVEAEYKEGAATITRLLEAELSLTQARTRLSATTYDRSLSRIVISHAVGEYPAKPDLAKPDGDKLSTEDEGAPEDTGPEVSSPAGSQPTGTTDSKSS